MREQEPPSQKHNDEALPGTGDAMNRHMPKVDLAELARHAMIERGLDPDFPAAALRQVAALTGPAGLWP